MINIWHYFFDNRSEITGWLQTTLWLSALPVVIGLAISLPLGWIASRYKWTYPPVVTLAGVIYTIPSIVLFLVLPGLLGTDIFDPVNVAVALTLYCIALLVRVVADGLSSVDDVTLAAASAMGFTGTQRLLRIQLPLAIPVIGAGLRVAAVSNVSLTSIAATLGVSQLGSLFTAGYYAPAHGEVPIELGLIIFVIIALAFDAIVLVALRLATPWQRAVVGR